MKKLLLLLLCAAGTAHAQSDEVLRDGFDPAGSCPAGRIASTMLSWRYDGIGRVKTDVTRAENIWGRSTAGGSVVEFPWLSYFAVFWAMPRNGYIAAAFTVPADFTDAAWGMFTHGETLPGPETDMAISSRCGDFNPPGEFCALYDTRTGQRMGVWRVDQGPLAACELEPGRTYFVNIRISDPTVQNFFCNAAVCQTTVQHNRTL